MYCEFLMNANLEKNEFSCFKVKEKVIRCVNRRTKW